jgi:hypothetical protein
LWRRRGRVFPKYFQKRLAGQKSLPIFAPALRGKRATPGVLKAAFRKGLRAKPGVEKSLKKH